tara:strand:- start:2056 stop:2403 length:348 start_codon:yes stop_codon:yes gene_type:complete
MLLSRQAEVEKRDRINQRHKDGGSFIPRAVMIVGTTAASATTTIINLPRYININNLIHAKFIIDTDTTNLWLINDIAATDAFSVAYNSDNNTIEVTLLDAGHQGVDFKLTVFYTG